MTCLNQRDSPVSNENCFKTKTASLMNKNCLKEYSS